MTIRSAAGSLMYLIQTYLTALPRVAYRSTLSLCLDPRGTQKFVHQVLNSQDLQTDDPILGSVEVTDWLPPPPPPNMPVTISGPYYRDVGGGIANLRELAILAYILRCLEPAIVFEIGTFRGLTTSLLATNSPNSCVVYTLDLPQEQVSHDVGEAFREHSCRRQIVQLFGDSMAFDFSPWYNRCDFVLVDGCHDYPFVASDSLNALQMCRPGGVIAWHDYRHTAWWSGVTRFVRELRDEYPTLVHLRGNTIAALRKLEASVR